MKRTVVVTCLAFGLICGWSSARADDLANVRAAIAEKGAAWEAGETSISVLPPAERRMRLGALEPVLTGNEQMLAPPDEAQAGTLPGALDWRNAGYVTSVKDQGNCGSCWAFSTTAALESAVLRGRGTPWVDLDLSEQVLVSCDTGAGCNGWYINYAADYVVANGLPADACYPYQENNGYCGWACANWKTCCNNKAASWGWVADGSAPSVNTIKNALVNNGPIVAQFRVYDDFYYYKGGIYAVSWGYYDGNHAILVVGYDDSTQSFTVKNSWGVGWGEGGYFRVAYSQLNSAIRFASYSIAYTPQRQYPLRVKIAGDGAGSATGTCFACAAGTCGRFYPSGSYVTVTAKAGKNQTFAGWTGCSSAAGTSCSVTLNSAAIVTATFLKPPAIFVSPAPVAFGPKAVSSSKSISVKIANAGTADLLVSSVSIGGRDSDSFSVTPSSCSAAVKKGLPCNVTVTFTPTSKAQKSALLVIQSNDPGLPTRNVILAGRGI